MLTIGCHLSSSKGYLAMGKEAVKIDAKYVSVFTRNPRGTKAKAIDENDVERFLHLRRRTGSRGSRAHALIR